MLNRLKLRRLIQHPASVAAAFALLAVLLVVKVSGQSVDDVFITYRYAQNLVAGNGFVFNPGEWVLATTAPGWGLLLAALHGLTGIGLEHLGTWLFGLCLVVVAGLAYREGRRHGRGPEAWLGGLLTVSCTFLWAHNGFEYPVSLALLLGAALTALRRPVVAGMLATAAVWCRPDAALVVACLGLLLLWEVRRDELELGAVVRFSAMVGLGVGLGMTLAWTFYGHPLPVTLGAKQAQGVWLSPETTGWGFWTSGYRWLAATYSGPWTPLMGIIGLAGLLRLVLLPSRFWRVLVASSLAISVAYPLLGVPFYTWYAMPLLIGMLYGYCCLAGDTLRALGRQWRLADPRRRIAWGALGALLLTGLAAFPSYVLWRSLKSYQLFEGFPRHQLYRDAGLWLADQPRSENDAFAFVEVGTVAFYSEWPARDLTGLVSPDLRPQADGGDLSGAFQSKPATWLISTERLDGMMGPVLQDLSQVPEPSHTVQSGAETLRLWHLRARLP